MLSLKGNLFGGAYESRDLEKSPTDRAVFTEAV